VTIPFRQVVRVGTYVLRQKLAGRKRYPLVLMLEPLFRCNLACAGCGKIDYPDKILNQRISVEDALASVDECGAPVVVMAAANRCCTRNCRRSSRASWRGRNTPSSAPTRCSSKRRWISTSPILLHLVGASRWRQGDARQVGLPDGVYDKAVGPSSRQEARLPRDDQLHHFQRCKPEKVAAFFDSMKKMGIDGITVSPGYAYERRPTSSTSSTAARQRSCSARSSSSAAAARLDFIQSTLFLDFLAGNQTYKCTPWGNPTRTVFGWPKACYLLGEGYAKTFKELMETRTGTTMALAIMRNVPTAWCIAASRRRPSTTPSAIR